jgi:protein-disulfide isomerase-like protein with CxxC motif
LVFWAQVVSYPFEVLDGAFRFDSALVQLQKHVKLSGEGLLAEHHNRHWLKHWAREQRVYYGLGRDVVQVELAQVQKQNIGLAV